MAGREKNCKWYFADQPIGQEVGPNNAMEQNFRKHPYASLIRESIQNSLDAVLDKTMPVRMEYVFKEMKGNDFPEFFDLKNHIKGCIDYYPTNVNAKANYEPMLEFFDDNKYHENIGYIRVSDYNTKGMDYDSTKTDSPFYAFVRSAGVSSKDNDSAGGSFGFGKAAYYLLSPISTIIVSTCTKNSDLYFEGISSLCTHLYKGVKKMAVGYYDDHNGHPISSFDDIPVPFRRSESGTDINILGFNLSERDEAVKEMIEAVLRHFWLAIYDGKLEVTVEGVQITSDNIAERMEEYFEDEEDTTKKFGFYNPRPYFEAVKNADTSKQYQCFNETLPILSHVRFYVNKSKNATDKILFMRSPKMLVYGKKNKTTYGVYGVFVCDSIKGNDILRAMENPAHDEWKASNWRISGTTKANPQGRVALNEIEEFISNKLNSIFSQKDKSAINIKGLEEFLYIPTDSDEDFDLDEKTDSNNGNPTGDVKEEGVSYTTDTPKENNPNFSNVPNSPSTGHIMINKTTTATNTTGGNLRSGHGSARQRPDTPGIQKPGDAKDVRTEDESGEKGIFATPIYVPYRTFSQVEAGVVYHHVVLHAAQEVGKVRLHFYAVGEESDEELHIAETNVGNVSGSIIRDIRLNQGVTKLKVRFTDNMKHSVKLSAEELHEVQ